MLQNVTWLAIVAVQPAALFGLGYIVVMAACSSVIGSTTPVSMLRPAARCSFSFVSGRMYSSCSQLRFSFSESTGTVWLRWGPQHAAFSSCPPLTWGGDSRHLQLWRIFGLPCMFNDLPLHLTSENAHVHPFWQSASCLILVFILAIILKIQKLFFFPIPSVFWWRYSGSAAAAGYLSLVRLCSIVFVQFYAWCSRSNLIFISDIFFSSLVCTLRFSTSVCSI